MCPLLPQHPPHPTHLLPQCLAGTGAWQRINTAVQLRSPRYPVFDLQDGQKYQFRVFSVNMYGSSEASAPSEPVQKVDEDGKGSAAAASCKYECKHTVIWIKIKKYLFILRLTLNMD